MLAAVSGDTLQLQCHGPDLGGFIVLLEELPQGLLLLQGLLQGHAHFKGNQFGELVGKTVGLALHPGHIADNRLGRHGTEGDNLGNRIAAILLRHIGDHPVTAIHTEVDIEIRHGDPLRVEESLKQQIVFQGIQIGNFQGIGHQGTGTGTPPGSHRDMVILGPADKVHHDQEIAGKTHLDNNIQLKFQPLRVALFYLGEILGTGVIENLQPLLQPLLRFTGKELVDGQPIGNRIVGKEVLAQPNIQGTAAGDLDTVLQGFGDIGENLTHLLRAAQVLLLGIAALAAGIVQGATLVNTDPGLVGLELIGIDKAHIIGRHHRAVVLGGQGHGGVEIVLLFSATCALQLQVEAVTKQRHIFL